MKDDNDETAKLTKGAKDNQVPSASSYRSAKMFHLPATVSPTVSVAPS